MRVIKQLESAIDKNRKIMVAYYGGSNPGDIRELTPISINEASGHFQAMCHSSNKVKTFRIQDTEIIGRAASSYHWEPKPSALSVKLSNFKEYLQVAGLLAVSGFMFLIFIGIAALVLWIGYKAIT